MTSKEKKQFYLEKFQSKPFIVKIGGEVIKSKKILKNILLDIKELFDRNIPIILVHGGGTQADTVSKQMGHNPTKIDGRRVTKEKDLEIVKMLFGGSLNLDILSILKQINLKGIRVSGLDGNLLETKKRKTTEIDYGFVGDIQSVNPQILFDLLEKKYLPIISPLGVDQSGTILNINADTMATEIAIAMQAEKLLLFTNTDGISNGEKTINTLNQNEAQKLIDDKITTDGMMVKINNALHAIKNKVKRVHILNGLSPHSLLKEVLTKKGIGTMIVSNQEKSIYETE